MFHNNHNFYDILMARRLVEWLTRSTRVSVIDCRHAHKPSRSFAISLIPLFSLFPFRRHPINIELLGLEHSPNRQPSLDSIPQLRPECYWRLRKWITDRLPYEGWSLWPSLDLGHWHHWYWKHYSQRLSLRHQHLRFENQQETQTLCLETRRHQPQHLHR